MITPTPRVVVPSVTVKGEVFQVKTIISHEMETGLRHDDRGNVIPRKIINRFVCRYNDVMVFSVDLHEAIAANPFFEFSLRATESGRLDFVWEEDGGAVYALSHQLTVA
ncbi:MULTISPECIES: thiosulfate oxidation carrier complex protein SoxZ [unclassified Mesorhizobium]|uniref:thiosulfate oxidation carrier complex protein SoxZ n=1 Tax=unclassified Mesorhizobium TaxID=325217 RepID=UPI000FD736AC|nr:MULTISPECIES: thiosulfate oxidation carrier complex protein SoxZ [unclassified Mesorhizobium]TGQ29096.1 thiosulfate oxidation carrier complex protein SoxZ [Mesorhizobium sp. M00.F.Ca.ET.216.01.1.1]TIS53457.1 MAG: thiosulfate oxidation carrier complex protein SoxZ [Mesorhizobium sp.]TIS89721.1 MAG: thiosulfate oxidation carrier complex protein SoxZ [Mesorhizobium sp.]